MNALVAEINRLRKERNAVILAHNYTRVAVPEDIATRARRAIEAMLAVG